jgi:predicted RNA-binding Zn-ribbon protein involved in translation (DUF1610 family)
MQDFQDKKKVIKNLKVQFIINCKCGGKIVNDELVKELHKYYCPKCGKEITSIGSE